VRRARGKLCGLGLCTPTLSSNKRQPIGSWRPTSARWLSVPLPFASSLTKFQPAPRAWSADGPAASLLPRTPSPCLGRRSGGRPFQAEPCIARRVNKMPRSHAEKCARRAGVSVRPAGALSPGWRCGRPGDRPRPRGIRCTRASCDRGGAARRPGAVYLTGPSLWRLANSG